MGGMSFEDSAKEDQQFMPENRQRINITVNDFYELLKMREDLVPDISREYILDKSKSDRLAKLLTCWQAGYFCIQCISRLAQELSITLLELNVFAHALCALALFAIWPDKPRDVCEPDLIVGDEAMDVCAVICLRFVVSDPKNDYRYIERWPTGYERHGTTFKLDLDRPISFVHDHTDREFVYLSGSDRAYCFEALGVGWQVWAKGGRFEQPHTSTTTIDLRDVRRLQRASRMYAQARTSSQYILNSGSVGSNNSFARTRNWSLDLPSYISNITNNFEKDRWSHGLMWRNTRFEWLALGVTIAGTCYGGLHIVAWKTPFASRPEALLWRASCVSIMAAGPWIALLNFLVLGFTYYRVHYPSDFVSVSHWAPIIRWLQPPLDPIVVVSGLLFLGSTPLWYLFCRMFIIVESFIMLAHISDQALQVSTWSAYVPHIV
jgi:hypothetical protein